MQIKHTITFELPQDKASLALSLNGIKFATALGQLAFRLNTAIKDQTSILDANKKVSDVELKVYMEVNELLNMYLASQNLKETEHAIDKIITSGTIKYDRSHNT